MSLKQFPFQFTNRNVDYLYTKGQEFFLNGSEYIGEYHIYNKTAKTGPVETDESKHLHPFYNNQDEYQYDVLLAKNNQPFLKEFSVPIPYIPKPSTADYSQGFLMRYFAKNLINPNLFVVEINRTQFFASKGGINPAIYQLLDIKWNIVGNSKEVFDLNTKTLVDANNIMPGIIYAVPNALQFLR